VQAGTHVLAIRARAPDLHWADLAMTELKVVLARLLSRFAFAPSPRYQHAPPGFGMPLVVTRL